MSSTSRIELWLRYCAIRTSRIRHSSYLEIMIRFLRIIHSLLYATILRSLLLISQSYIRQRWVQDMLLYSQAYSTRENQAYLSILLVIFLDIEIRLNANTKTNKEKRVYIRLYNIFNSFEFDSRRQLPKSLELALMAKALLNQERFHIDFSNKRLNNHQNHSSEKLQCLSFSREEEHIIAKSRLDELQVIIDKYHYI